MQVTQRRFAPRRDLLDGRRQTVDGSLKGNAKGWAAGPRVIPHFPRIAGESAVCRQPSDVQNEKPQPNIDWGFPIGAGDGLLSRVLSDGVPSAL